MLFRKIFYITSVSTFLFSKNRSKIQKMRPPKKRKYYQNLASKKWQNFYNAASSNAPDSNQAGTSEILMDEGESVENRSHDETESAEENSEPEVANNTRITKKLELMSETVQNVDSSIEYVLLDFSQLSKLFTKVKCSVCGSSCLELDLLETNNGFARKISLNCKHCELAGLEDSKTEIFTSKRVSDSKSKRPGFDINLRLSTAFLYLGKGYSGVEQFAMIMNMIPFCSKSFEKYLSLLSKSATKTSETIIDECRKEVKQAYRKISNDVANKEKNNGDVAIDFDDSEEEVSEAEETEDSENEIVESSENLREKTMKQDGEIDASFESSVEDNYERIDETNENFEMDSQSNVEHEINGSVKNLEEQTEITSIETEKSVEVLPNNEDELTECGVTYDGSWPTRGHKSKHGFGAVIDIITGYIVDYDIASKYCAVCEVTASELGRDSPDFDIWYQGHAENCDVNHEGSSGLMETTVAEIIWKRSESYGFRYTTMLSDGDSKTFNHLNSLNIYGSDHPLSKEECINHVSKR